MAGRCSITFGTKVNGYAVYLFGGVVSFASKFLKVVAMSSAEAEYAAASQTCREMPRQTPGIARDFHGTYESAETASQPI